MKTKEIKKILKNKTVAEIFLAGSGLSWLKSLANEKEPKQKNRLRKKNLKNIALLIDADNTQLAKLRGIIDEVSAHGHIAVKRAYGNWKAGSMVNWEAELKRLAIKAEQQFDYVKGKNAADMALTIDAVNLLNKGMYDAFVIVSSDSDYTPLALHLRESGAYVIGFGKGTTSEFFQNCCDEFLFVEDVPTKKAVKKTAQKKEPKETNKEEQKKELKEKPKADPKKEAQKGKEEKGESFGIENVHDAFEKIHKMYKDADGYTNIGLAGYYIRKEIPEFNVKLFGHSKLTKFFEAYPDKYEVIKMIKGKSNIVNKYKCR